MFAGLAFFTAVVLYWVSNGFVEGWKWKNPDRESPWVSANTYHVWRALSTFSFMAAASSTPWVYSDLLLFLSLVVLANAAGWVLYERTMSIVEKGDFMAVRGETWHLVNGINIPRLKPITDVAICILSTYGYWLLTFLHLGI